MAAISIQTSLGAVPGSAVIVVVTPGKPGGMERFTQPASPIQASRFTRKCFHDNNQPGTRILNFFSASLNRFALARAVPTNARHSANTSTTALDKLISDYVINGRVPDLSSLICQCMTHGRETELRNILARQDIGSLCIRGPMDAWGWETLVNAMPDRFPAAMLTLSNLVFDRFTVELLFQALGKMPALVNLFLHGVEAEANVSDASEYLALKQLKTLSVVEAGVGEPSITLQSRVSVCPVLIKILEGCQVRSLNIRGLRFEVPGKGNRKLDGPVVTAAQNANLGEAICRQSELLVLRIKECHALAHFQDASLSLDFAQDCGHLVQLTPVYKMPSLRLLDLSGNRLPGRTTASILVALGQDGTCLRHLNLTGNFIGNDTVAAMAFLLVKNSTLLSLSFEHAKALDIHGAEAEHLVNQGELKQLTEALEHNTSLRRLRFEAAPGLDRSALFACLERNREAFKVSALRAMLNSSGYRLPKDLVDHFAKEGAPYLAERDALNLSSVNKKAFDARHRLLQGDGASM